MTKQKKDLSKENDHKKNNLEPNIINKIIGVLSIIGIPLLIAMAVLGKLIETIFNLFLDKFKNPLSYLEGFKNSILEIFSKSFIISLYYSNLFMVQTGVHYDRKNEFLESNPDFFESKGESKSLFSIDLSIPFISKKNEDKNSNNKNNDKD